MQIYTENWVNSPGQQEDNSWQSFVFVPKDNWYIAKASFTFLRFYAQKRYIMNFDVTACAYEHNMGKLNKVMTILDAEVLVK